MKISILDSRETLKGEELLDKLYAFDQNYFKWPWSKQNWKDFFQTRPDSLLLLIENEGTVKALCLVEYNGDSSYLHKICVDKKLEGQGYGQALIGESCKKLKAQGVQSLSLEVDVNNERAISFYERLGFCSLGRRRKFYSDGSDAFVYEITLV